MRGVESELICVAAFTVDQMLKDVGAMTEELLLKTLPPQTAASAKK
jgi:hypothetical protein